MHLPIGLLSLFLFSLVQGAPPAQPPTPLQTATSPDGYSYVVEKEPYVSRTITLKDGTTSEVMIHPRLAEAVPDQGTSPNHVTRFEWKKGQKMDFCGASSFIDKSSGNSPFVGDCAAVETWARDNWGWVDAPPIDFRVKDNWLRLVTAGSCAFGIKTSSTCLLLVGNTDVADLTRDAIASFQADGRVGAEGAMRCDSMCSKYTMRRTRQDTQWALFWN